MHRDRALLLQASSAKPLLILMALWGVWACYCRWMAVHPNGSPIPLGTAVKLLSWDLEVGEDLLDLHMCRHLTVTRSLVLTSQAVLFSCHPGLGERRGMMCWNWRWFDLRDNSDLKTPVSKKKQWSDVYKCDEVVLWCACQHLSCT